MQDTPRIEPELPPALPPVVRFLRMLVIVLTITMIAGLITIVAVIVIRFPQSAPPTPPFPDSLALPSGVVPQAVTQGGDWVAVVSGADEILIFDRATGALRQRVRIEAAD